MGGKGAEAGEFTLKWHLESWRKIYRTCPPSWLRLSVSARGLGSELLKYSEDDGSIDIGTDAPGVAVAYMLGARPREHKRISEDVAELLRDGYLVQDGQKLLIRNFVEAQDRTPGAKRTAAWRAQKDAREPSPVTSQQASHETSHETSRVQGEVTTTRSDTTRSDTTRIQETRDPAPLAVEVDPAEPAKAGPHVREVFEAHLMGWRQHVGRGAEPALTPKRQALIKARLKEHPLEVVAKAAGGIWASSWHRENGQTSIDLAMRDAAHVERFSGDPVKATNGMRTRQQLGLQGADAGGEY